MYLYGYGMVNKMKILLNQAVKNIIAIVALVNIVVMMLFEYGLPSPAASAKENSAAEQTAEQDDEVGTIDQVAQEAAEKEEEAVETALAKEEKEEAEESEEAEEAEEERDPDAPILELTDDHIYLKVGDRFNYMSYIKTMKDVDGSDLSHYIHLDRDVDTSQPGEIELTYRITSVITGKSDSKVLLITIQE